MSEQNPPIPPRYQHEYDLCEQGYDRPQWIVQSIILDVGRLEAELAALRAEAELQTDVARKWAELCSTVRRELSFDEWPALPATAGALVGKVQKMRQELAALRERIKTLEEGDLIWEQADKRQLETIIAQRDELAALRAENEALRRERLELWDAIIPPRPRCRDCADSDGTCTTDDKPCEPHLRAMQQLTALRAKLEAAAKALLYVRRFGLHGDVEFADDKRDLNKSVSAFVERWLDDYERTTQ